MSQHAQRNFLGCYNGQVLIAAKVNMYKNPEDRKKRDKEYAKAHPEVKKASLQKWRKKYPEKALAKSRQNDARRSELVNARRDKFLLLQDGKCALCGKKWKPEDLDKQGRTTWHLDHDHSCCDKPSQRSCGKCDRGVLCWECNVRLIGTLEHFKHLIPLAITYLGWQTIEDSNEN